MRVWHAAATTLMVSLCAAQPALSQGFKFSNPDPVDEQEKQEKAEARAQAIADIWTPCRADLKNKKIMVLIGERQSNGYIAAQQQNYGPHYDAINRRLRELGLRTYTPEEIRHQIAQAEIDAYFRNDPDAALSASKRVGASFVLRGLITAQSTPNPLIRVNQVTVDMDFTLSAANGRPISDAHASTASYAGADVSKMALTLVNEKADEVVPKLYADYCRNAGSQHGSGPK
ncbi:MAG TPA: hypothetical protein VGI14_11925 [Casimicrobiaceae bacterium]|jgi:hypothetical protein